MVAVEIGERDANAALEEAGIRRERADRRSVGFVNRDALIRPVGNGRPRRSGRAAAEHDLCLPVTVEITGGERRAGHDRRIEDVELGELVSGCVDRLHLRPLWRHCAEDDVEVPVAVDVTERDLKRRHAAVAVRGAVAIRGVVAIRVAVVAVVAAVIAVRVVIR